ncbi:WD repeat-containing protein 43 [Phtheirospermum japonicum]|uniref:WD repeat-containing protein 43 n=1 Tax=Phtheirospermum japonicum TaxID=374723 RepID=A0A830D372_9LAMI|nr:WD repeat-containing protein 43 [Phtheirospermum japonicum]
MIATAAAQLKIFNSSNHKKLQKFSGHPGPVRCMIFSEDGKYVLSSALGERYVAVWKIDGSKTKSSSALLAMEHPAVFLDTRCGNNGNSENAGLSVLAITETGVCYFWHGKTIDELRNSKPTKIYVHCDDGFVQKSKGTVPNVFAAKLQNVTEPACGHVFLAHSFLIKPTFQKVAVKSGTDVKLSVSQDGGVLLPVAQSSNTKKKSDVQSQVTALDSSNTDGALLPVPKMFDLNNGKSETKTLPSKDESGLDSVTLCMEDRLRSLGILKLSSTLDSKKFNGINLDASTPHKKIKATVSSMEPSDAWTLLKSLVDIWQSRSHSGKHVLPWICCILVHHSDYVKSQEEPKLLNYLYKVSKSKVPTINSLFQLSGRLQLVSAQIDKASNIKQHVMQHDEQEDESEDEDVDEVVYGVDGDDSQTGSESDD